MKIEVDGQFKKFWLAYPQQWVPFYGHEIKIGKYSFCAGGTERGIVVSETSTGSRVITLPHNFLTHIMAATREGTLDYYETFVAPMLMNAIKRNDLDKMLVEMKKKSLLLELVKCHQSKLQMTALLESRLVMFLIERKCTVRGCKVGA